jgi:hypothetical protein
VSNHLYNLSSIFTRFEHATTKVQVLDQAIKLFAEHSIKYSFQNDVFDDPSPIINGEQHKITRTPRTTTKHR